MPPWVYQLVHPWTHATACGVVLAVLIGVLVWIKRRRAVINETPDDDDPLSPAQFKSLYDAMVQAAKEHESEKRKSIEVSTAFLDKLAALDAGSIAAAASILLAIANKGNIHCEPYRTAVHHLLIVAALLWASLVLAILHNFLVTKLAKLYADLSEAEYLVKIITHSAPYVKQIELSVTDDILAQIEQMMRDQQSPKVKRMVAEANILYPATTWIRHISTGIFVLAYTLVLVFLRTLW